MRRHGDAGMENSPDYTDAMGGFGLKVAMNSIEPNELMQAKMDGKGKRAVPLPVHAWEYRKKNGTQSVSITSQMSQPTSVIYKDSLSQRSQRTGASMRLT